MCLMFTFGGIGIILFAPFVFDTILEGRYDEGLSVLPMTLVYCIWFGLTCVAQNYLWVVEKGKWIALSVGVGLAINLGLNWLLIPHFGVSGAVIATAISNGLLLATIYIFNRFAGCTMDGSIWICSAIPIILLLPVSAAIVISAVIALIGYKSAIIFSDAEKAEIGELGISALDKLGLSKRV